MREMSWRDRAVDWLEFYGPPCFTLFITISGLVGLLMATADVRGLSGTVEDVVAVHGESPYSIVTIDGDVGIADPGQPVEVPMPNPAEYTDI